MGGESHRFESGCGVLPSLLSRIWSTSSREGEGGMMDHTDSKRDLLTLGGQTDQEGGLKNGN